MTKSFLVFPTGLAGAALLLLRASVAAMLAVVAGTMAPAWQEYPVILLVIALIFGFFTPWAAAAGAVMVFYAGLRADGTAGTAMALHGVSAAALMLLGAGAIRSMRGFSVGG